jgi:hypothetical protein
MCFKNTVILLRIATYTIVNTSSLSKGRRAGNSRGKILYRGISYLLKKTQPAIPSYQLLIAGLETKSICTYESSNNFYQIEAFGSTTFTGKYRCTPPPRKSFSDSKDFLHYGIFNIGCGYRCIHARSSGGGTQCLTS